MIKTVKRFSLKRILGQLHLNSNDFRSGTQSKFSFNRTRKKGAAYRPAHKKTAKTKTHNAANVRYSSKT